MKLLLLDDDRILALSLKEQLSDQYAVDTVSTSSDARYYTQLNEYDVIIVDYSLPDGDGVSFCRHARQNKNHTPILLLTGRASVDDTVSALDAGADDYLTKPFHMKELRARLRALLRRSRFPSHSDTALVVGALVLDLTQSRVTRDGTVIPLRRKEFGLLEYLMRHPGQLVTRRMLLEHVWETDSDVITNTVDVHMSYLRKKVDKPFAKALIKTMHGFGYKIEE